MVLRLMRRRGAVTLALLVLVAEVTGLSATTRVDRALQLEPLAPTDASYYPWLLVATKVLAALALAALLARAARAQAAAAAGDRLLAAVAHGHKRAAPKLRPGLSPRVWLASFLATSLIYLVHADVERVAAGRWPLLSPWLHTYALPVFAAVSVLVAVAWRFASWVHAVEDYAVHTIARVRRLLGAAARIRAHHPRAGDDTAPRRRFGLAFESRPPPLPA